MGNMEGSLGNATPTTSLHQLQWWNSPRWIVIRIEALAVVAIIITFLLVAFGSCRRWSNSWIVQKGFFAAQVLSLSLGTYTIGLMQSSSVKSEMYPIWTVSLFTLFGCIDPVTTYNGLDYKGVLSKVVYGICLNCGYVLLMSISTISNVVGKAAIITLSIITFIKGFHRSFALVQQNKMRDMVYELDDKQPLGEELVFRNPDDLSADIEASIGNYNKDTQRLCSCFCVHKALRLSHKLRRYFLGLDYREPRLETLDINFKQLTLEMIEIELAFVYDAFFTGNPFLHYYQAKTASLWALVSFTGICFVLVATAIPGTMSSTRRGASGGCNEVLDTTIADLTITFGILVSLALLQLMQLGRSWTSNWARAAVACAYARNELGCFPRGGWMRFKMLVATSTNLFNMYLWQDKISQYSILPKPRQLSGWKRKGEGISSSETEGEGISLSETKGERRGTERVDLVQMLGLHYIWLVIWELFSSDINKRGGVKLDTDLKDCVINFLEQIQSNILDRNWLSSLPEEPKIRHFLPHVSDSLLLRPEELAYRYTSCVMTWHIVTWYCELAEQKKRPEDALMSKQAEEPIGCGRETAATASYYLRKAAAAIPRPGYCFQRRGGGGGEEEGTKTRDQRVANSLSMYCVYLVKSAPELLPGPVAWTTLVYDCFAREAKRTVFKACDKNTTPANMSETILENMSDHIVSTDWYTKEIKNFDFPDFLTENGQGLAKLLMDRPDETWKTLALVWAQLLVYAAPYGNAEAHMRRLSQGGEFITHLWALLYHLDIREWKVEGNLTEITTKDDADRVIFEESQAVVAYLRSRYGTDQDQVATASRLVEGVRYYYTSDLFVFKHFFGIHSLGIRRNKQLDIVFLKIEGIDTKCTFYDGEFHAYDIARFVTENKIALAHDQAQAQSENGGRSSVQKKCHKRSSSF